MKKWHLLFILVSLSLSGCWDRVEVDEIGIVLGIGVDRVPDDKRPILLTLQVVNPAAIKSGETGSGQGQSLYVLTSQGRTFFSALQAVSTSYPRRFIFSHNQLVVFGKDFAKTDITEVMNYIDRDREFRENIWVIAAEKTAKEVLQTEIALETLSPKGLDIMMSKFTETAFTLPIEFYKFRNLLKAETKTATAPLIRIEEREKKVERMLAESTEEKMAKSKFALDPTIVIEETAIFHDKKMVGVISQNESRGLLWLKNQLTGGTVVINGKDDQEISVMILKGKTKIFPSVKGNQIFMKIECKGEATIEEVENDALDLNDPKVIKQLEKQTAAIIKSRVRRTIEKAQHELNVDFIGFSSILHNELPDEWKRFSKDWPEVFPQVQYEIDVQITLSMVGKIIK
ncbi:Ger(x)C family spore germination protein [Ammoniphilus sp. 3BR4]|uniref:Ger(x)C family spore germination protein n=1 Tax=Ammoniphilus sp. 3BR4 TaxID=3158265 RepID=UPI0034666C70